MSAKAPQKSRLLQAGQKGRRRLLAIEEQPQATFAN
jgi:hypothetical protein